MRDTVWAILLTQTPIAIACLWVAWEMRGVRRAMVRLGRATERLAGVEEDDGPGPHG